MFNFMDAEAADLEGGADFRRPHYEVAGSKMAATDEECGIIWEWCWAALIPKEAA